MIRRIIRSVVPPILRFAARPKDRFPRPNKLTNSFMKIRAHSRMIQFFGVVLRRRHDPTYLQFAWAVAGTRNSRLAHSMKYFIFDRYSFPLLCCGQEGWPSTRPLFTG